MGFMTRFSRGIGVMTLVPTILCDTGDRRACSGRLCHSAHLRRGSRPARERTGGRIGAARRRRSRSCRRQTGDHPGGGGCGVHAGRQEACPRSAGSLRLPAPRCDWARTGPTTSEGSGRSPEGVPASGRVIPLSLRRRGRRRRSTDIGGRRPPGVVRRRTPCSRPCRTNGTGPNRLRCRGGRARSGSRSS